MDRKELEEFIQTSYETEPDRPWAKYPDYLVFRHRKNKKWFALLMNVPANKLGLQGEEGLDIVNLKCDPVLVASLCREPGFFPAYHMSKTKWISVALDGTVPGDQIRMLLDMSFEATREKSRSKGAAQ
jgi:predicted DNA-binding protein (MmcQ/YjbR family)